MPLEKEDLQTIDDRVTQVIQEQLSNFLKDKVAPMVSGATKRALSEAPQLTAETLQEQLTTFQENIAKAQPQVDAAALVQQAVDKVLKQLAAEAPETPQPETPGTSQPVDIEDVKNQIRAEFEDRDKAMRDQLTILQKETKEAKEAKEEAERKALITSRNDGFINALLKTGQIDSGAGRLAMQAAIDAGYIHPHPDNEGEFVVKEKDSLGIEDVYVAATDRLDVILKKPELQYFRPARAGTGTGATPAQAGATGNPNPTFKVLPSGSPENISAEVMLDAMQSGKGDELFADLAALDKAS